MRLKFKKIIAIVCIMIILISNVNYAKANNSGIAVKENKGFSITPLWNNVKINVSMAKQS